VDADLRQLERRYRESGDPRDELAWLVALARSGEELEWDAYLRLYQMDLHAAAEHLRARGLGRARLELAAHLGHLAARELLDDPDEPPQDLGEWALGLLGYGRTLSARPEPGGPMFEGPDWADSEARAQLQAELAEKPLGQVWVEAGQEALIRAGLAVLQVRELTHSAERGVPGIGPIRLQEAAEAVSNNVLPTAEAWQSFSVSRALPLRGLDFVAHGFSGNSYPWLRRVTLLQFDDEEGELERCLWIQRQLLPWALDVFDPLAD